MKLSDYLVGRHAVTEFSDKTGIAKQTIYKYLSGLRTPRHDFARLIVRHTKGKVSFEDIYG